MTGNWRKRFFSRTILGLDIRDDGAAAVKISVSPRSRVRVEKAASREFRPGTDHEAQVRSFIEDFGRAADRIVTALPVSAALVRPVELPFTRRRKLEKIISFQMAAMMPYPVEDYIVSMWPPDRKKKTTMLAAVRKSDLSAHLGLLGRLLIDPQIVTLGDFAWGQIRPFPAFGASGRPVCLIFIGGKTATFQVFSEGKIPFFRKTGKIDADGVRETLQLWAGANPVPPDMEIFVGGRDDAAAAAVAARIRDACRRPSATWRPVPADGHDWRRLSDEGPGKTSVALGLALGGMSKKSGTFNFRKDAFRVTGGVHGRASPAYGAAALAVLLVVLGGKLHQDVGRLQDRSDRLSAHIHEVMQRSFPDLVHIVKGREKLQMQRSVRDGMEKNRGRMARDRSPGVMDRLGDLSAAVAGERGVRIDDLDLAGQHLRVTGIAGRYEQVDRLKTLLEKTGFRNVRLVDAGTEKQAGGICFHLTMESGGNDPVERISLPGPGESRASRSFRTTTAAPERRP